MGLIGEVIFGKNTLGRIILDLPLIYFAIVGSMVAQYIYTTSTIDFGVILSMMGASLVAIGIIFVIYIVLWKFFHE